MRVGGRWAPLRPRAQAVTSEAAGAGSSPCPHRLPRPSRRAGDKRRVAAGLHPHVGNQSDVVDEVSTVDVRHAEGHLRLVVNEDEGAVFWSVDFRVLAQDVGSFVGLDCPAFS